MSNAHVSIDFWNTIVIGKTGGELRQQRRLEVLQEVASRQQRQLTLEEVKEAQKKVSKEFNKVWLGEQRTHSPYELVVMLLRMLNLQTTEQEIGPLVTAIENTFLEGAPGLAPHCATVIPQLAERYSLSIISDTMFTPGRVLREYLRRKGLYNYFDTFVFSNEVGYSKPNREAFTQVLEHTECAANASYHIGDLQQTDIRGAQSVGMKAILYTGITEGEAHESTADYIMDDWDKIGALLIS